jgi:hypothetical protein
MSTARDLATLFRRDLAKLIQHIESFPNDESQALILPNLQLGAKRYLSEAVNRFNGLS